MSTLLKNTLILGALMNITNETMCVIEQSLFDTYGIKSKISFFFKTHYASIVDHLKIQSMQDIT